MKKIDVKQLLNKFIALFTHNWPWKLLSLVLAICLWSGLITQDGSLSREKVFTDVPISAVNADTLRRNGFIIVSGLDDLPTARLTVDVPQKNYNTVTAGNYNLRVDLSRIREAGEQTLPVLSSSTSTYGTVTSISVESITVQVEEYVSRSRIPVRLNSAGMLPSGFYGSDPQVDPSFVMVSGPKSLVDSVVRCVADYNLSAVTPSSGTERTAVPFRLLDSAGEEISSSLIDVTSQSVSLDSITVSQTLYIAKSLVINTADLVTGVPQEGCSIKRISAEPATVVAAGKDAFINSLNELHIAEYIDQPIDVSGMGATLTRNVSLIKPSDIVYFGNDTIMITVEIAPK